jgi:hypothetical protein
MAESQHTPTDTTNSENTFSSRVDHLYALIIAAFFVVIVSFNILYPSPSGPPDNGDFNRIFSSFSSGPLGHDFWPPLENQEAYQKRFFNFYHRFWRQDEGRKEFVHLTSSRLFFWPGRLLNLTPGTFDLAWNAFLLSILAGCVLYLSLKNIGRSPTVFSLGVLAFIFADANIVGYLNSFYQESGAFLSFLFLVCSLHVFWVRRNLCSLLIILALSLVLAGTKTAYTLSVLPAIFPILVGVIVFTPKSSYLRRYVISAVLLLLFVSILFVKFLSVTPGNERRANCYHFIFSGAIPLLSSITGESFLHELGLDPSLIRLGGKNAYQSGSEFETEPLRSGLTSRLHRKAAVYLAFYHPVEFLKLIKLGFSQAGFYPRLQYPPALSDPPEVTFPFRWLLWSKLHDSFLHGIPYYAVVLSLTSILGILLWKRKDSGWPHFLLLAATGFIPASLLQILIAIMGNGPLDIVKHLYFGNLLLDGAFIFVVCGLTSVVITFWKERKTGVKDMRSKDRCTDVKIPNRPLVQDVKSGRLKTFCLCLFAFFIYLLVIFKIGTRPFSDFQFYYEVALGILRGEPISSFYKYFQPAGYPYLLSILFILFKTESILIPQLFNALMLAVLLWISLKYPCRKHPVSLFVGYFVMAFNLNYLSMVSVLCSEIPYVFFFLIGLFFFRWGCKKNVNVEFDNGRGQFVFFLSGLFFGISQFIRPVTFAYLLVFSFFMLLGSKYFIIAETMVNGRNILQRIIRSLILTWGSFFIAAIPLYWVSGYGLTWMPLQKGLYSLYVGFNTESKGNYNSRDAEFILRIGKNYQWNSERINREFRLVIYDRVKNNWLKNLENLPKKLYHLLNPQGIPFFAIERSEVKNRDIIYKISGYFSWINVGVLFISLWAWIICLVQKKRTWEEFFVFCLVGAAFVYLILHGYFFEIQPRYSNHLWMIMFWCYPLSQQVVWDSFKKSFRRREKLR